MLQASLAVYHCVMDRRMNCSGSTAVTNVWHRQLEGIYLLFFLLPSLPAKIAVLRLYAAVLTTLICVLLLTAKIGCCRIDKGSLSERTR